MTTANQSNADKLREQLAAIEHERWADWQKYVHGKGKARVVDGEAVWCLPMSSVRHWNRQIATPYAELSEREKQSDREQVDRYWHLIEEYVQAAKHQLVRDIQAALPAKVTDPRLTHMDINVGYNEALDQVKALLATVGNE